MEEGQEIVKPEDQEVSYEIVTSRRASAPMIPQHFGCLNKIWKMTIILDMIMCKGGSQIIQSINKEQLLREGRLVFYKNKLYGCVLSTKW